MKSSFQILSDRNETLLTELQAQESELRNQLKHNLAEMDNLERQLDAFSKGISPGRTINLESLRSFMGSIAMQKEKLLAHRQTLSTQLQCLLEEQRSVQLSQAKYTAILSRHDTHLRRVEAKREQKSNDEYASRAWRSSHSPAA